MTVVNVYLNFDGNCEEAFNFYKSVFGGDFTYVGKFKDMPPQEDMPPMSEEMGDKIMHISLPVSSETSIMGSDTGGEWAQHFKMGNNFSISISTDSKEEADRLYNGLSAGGNASMPMNQTFWGDYFGMFTDKFGVNWMVSFNENPPPKG
jgi:PhnB protein